MTKKSNDTSQISARSFATAIIVIFALMIATYVLTLTVPSGEYARITDADGNVSKAKVKSIEGLSAEMLDWVKTPVKA